MKEFGVRTLKEGYNGFHHIDRWQLTKENVNTVLDIHRDYRIEGDFEEMWNFLTNPDQKDAFDLYLGETRSYLGTDEEYFAMRLDS